MNVLLVNNYYSPNVFGGGERSVQELAEALTRDGVSVSVMTQSLDGVSKVAEVNGVTVRYLAMANLGASVHQPRRGTLARVAWQVSSEFNPRVADATRRVIEATRPDIVHTNNLPGFSADVWLASRRLGVPIVHTLRTYFVLCARATMFRGSRNCQTACWSCRVFTRRRRVRSRAVDAVVGNSRFILDQHLRCGAFPNARVQTVVFSSYRPSSRSAKVAACNASGPLRIGYLGRIHPTKGIELLLRGLGELQSREWTLRLAGKGLQEYEEELRRRYPHASECFTGWCNDLQEFFASIDLLVIPSLWHEPLPRTIFEAFGHGCPVVVSNRGGSPEAVTAGVTGWVFDPDDPAQLARILASAVANPGAVRSMADDCRRGVATYSPERHAAGYRAVYEAIGKPVGGAQ